MLIIAAASDHPHLAMSPRSQRRIAQTTIRRCSMSTDSTKKNVTAMSRPVVPTRQSLCGRSRLTGFQLCAFHGGLKRCRAPSSSRSMCSSVTLANSVPGSERRYSIAMQNRRDPIAGACRLSGVVQGGPLQQASLAQQVLGVVLSFAELVAKATSDFAELRRCVKPVCCRPRQGLRLDRTQRLHASERGSASQANQKMMNAKKCTSLTASCWCPRRSPFRVCALLRTAQSAFFNHTHRNVYPPLLVLSASCKIPEASQS